MIARIGLTKRVLEACIDLLGFEAPEKMRETAKQRAAGNRTLFLFVFSFA